MKPIFRRLIAAELYLAALGIGAAGVLVWRGHHRAALAPTIPAAAYSAARYLARREARRLESIALETLFRRLPMQTQIASLVAAELNKAINAKLPADLQPSVNALIVAAVTAAEVTIQKYGAQLLAKVLPATK